MIFRIINTYMNAKDVIDCFKKNLMKTYVGVPCSILSPLITMCEKEEDILYINASNEGEALAIGCGLALNNELPVIMLQNSGLGNTINPLTSLAIPYNFACFMCVSVRGKDGINDEPQHLLMGSITEKLLELMGIKYLYFDESIYEQIIMDLSTYAIENNMPVALLFKKSDLELIQPCDSNYVKDLSQIEILKYICDRFSNWTFFTTTGKTSRELWYINKGNSNKTKMFHMYGSMGCACALGFGYKLKNNNEKIIIIDGDGAILMKLGNLATIGKFKPRNFLHIVIDNGQYYSTGGQATNSDSVNIANVAKACGYEITYDVNNYKSLYNAVENILNSRLLTMLVIHVKANESPGLGRPKELLMEMKNRFLLRG